MSAGLLMYKLKNGEINVFLVHPGGPFWKNKDEGAWSIPKGELNDNEDALSAAMRETFEETGIKAPDEKEKYIYLGFTKTKSGKVIHAWAFEGDWNGELACTTYVERDDPKRGKLKFPEVDKAAFFPLAEAKKKIHPSQLVFLEQLEKKLKNPKLESSPR